jgi:F0F1-type ATP synthase assembly protein I
VRDQGSIPDLPPELTANVSRSWAVFRDHARKNSGKPATLAVILIAQMFFGAFVGKFMDQEWDLRGNCAAIF